VQDANKKLVCKTLFATNNSRANNVPYNWKGQVKDMLQPAQLPL